MTPRELFHAAYNRTVKATGQKFDGAHADECWRQVQGYAASLYDDAATRLLSVAKYLPRPSEWRDVLDQLAAEQEQEARRQLDDELAAHASSERYYCAVCHDTGWEPVQHPGTGEGRCPLCNRKHLYDHIRLTECLCRPTNPHYQREVQRTKDMAASRQQPKGKAA